MLARYWQCCAALIVACFFSGCGFGLSQTAIEKEVARFKVKVVQADAKVYFAGALTKQKGVDRIFVSQPLDRGTTYTIKIKTVWEPNNYTKITRIRSLDVKAGQTYSVDLTKLLKTDKEHIKIRYVPTPQIVVDGMLKLASVGKGDVVFDLGCGDGRIVITAVKSYGAVSGVGIDIDAERIRESLANAKKAGVTGKVKFREGDVLKKIDDLESASVVMLYMGDDVNLRLRPHLRKRLKPGSRVVSHRFLMGDWKPDKSITVTDGKGTRYELHSWIIKKK